MADVFHTNLAPATATPLWLIWKLVNAMITAGYTIVASGDGTTSGVDTTNRWATYAGLGSGSWICLHHPGLGFDIVFWMSAASTDSGKIIVGKANAFSVGAFPSRTASDPGTIPATAGYFRGSSGAFSAWTGATYAPGTSQIGVKDIAGAHLGAWFLLGATPAYSAGSSGHSLKFSPLDPAASAQGTDPEPYAFQGPPGGGTATYGSYFLESGLEFKTDSAAGTTGGWYGYRADGAWSTFGGAVLHLHGETTSLCQLSPSDPYGSGGYFLEEVTLFKRETAMSERKGRVRSFRACASSVPKFDTMDANVWAKFSETNDFGWVVFWDGVTTAPTFT